LRTIQAQINPHSMRVPIGIRLLAFLWDYLIISGYLLLLVGISFIARPLLIPLFTKDPITAELTGFLFITLPVYLYFAICEGSPARASWGKRKMGIAVANMQGGPISIGRSLFRSAIKFIPWELAHFTIWHVVIPSGYPDEMIYTLFAVVYGLAFIFLISPLWNARRQTLYDSIARTVVLYKNR